MPGRGDRIMVHLEGPPPFMHVSAHDPERLGPMIEQAPDVATAVRSF